MKETLAYAIKKYTTILSKHGLPKQFLKDMATEITSAAFSERDSIRQERISAVIALSVRRVTERHKHAMGARMLCEILYEYGQMQEGISDGTIRQKDLMEELDRKTGLVVRTGKSKDRFIVEYMGKDWERILEILAAEEVEESEE